MYFWCFRAPSQGSGGFWVPPQHQRICCWDLGAPLWALETACISQSLERLSLLFQGWNPAGSIPTHISRLGKPKSGSNGQNSRAGKSLRGWALTWDINHILGFSWTKVSGWAFFSLLSLPSQISPVVCIYGLREEWVWRHFPAAWQSWVAFQQRCSYSALGEHSKGKELWRNGDTFL